MTAEERIAKALQIASDHGTTDGGHHKMWCIDQMVRALTGCPVVEDIAEDCNGVDYIYEKQGESEEYHDFIRQHCAGEDGPCTYHWDVGIP